MADRVNYDANNNDDQGNDWRAGGATKRAKNNHLRVLRAGAKTSFGAASGKCQNTSQAEPGVACALDCAPNADAWHLLDEDGQSIAASTSAPSSSNEQEFANESCAERRLTRRRSTDEKSQQPATTVEVRKRPRKKQASHEVDRRMMSGRQLQRQHQGEGELSRALVVACTALYALLPLASLIAFTTFIILLFTRYWPLTVLYYAYVIYDSKTCNRGGRRIEAVHKSKFWTYLAAHFPVRLSYSSEFRLDPKENYILNYHPHGIAAFGCVSAFATDALNFSKLFPGITARFMVHETSFLVPVMREFFTFRGDCSVNSKSFDYILSKKWQPRELRKRRAGNLLALCGGGLAEADLSDAECLKIVAASRKGFVKKALIHGANLIPCIAFGENSVFTKVNLKRGSLLQRLESQFYKLFKFKHPIYYGASLLLGDTSSGIMPYKRPITVVMGDPIPVERVAEPSQEQIDQLHAKYLDSLREIYANNKRLCTKYDVKLELV